MHIFIVFTCFANNLALAHDDPQTQAWREVSAAYQAWDIADDHADDLMIWKVDVKGELRDARQAQGSNREQYRDSIVGMLRALSIDPLNVASNAATEIALLVLNLSDSISLNEAVSTAESMLSHVESVLYTYRNEAAHRLTYYNGKKKAYEDQYGPLDPNAPPTLPPPHSCVRGDACTKKLTDPAGPTETEKHQESCQDRIDHWFLGIGERACTGHVYNCDEYYVCERVNDHKMDWSCPHKRIRVGDIEKHKMLMPGPCNSNPSHDYYACDKTHEFVETGRCQEKALAEIWNDPWGYEDVYVICTNQSSYYKCTPHTHSYPAQSSSGTTYYYR